MCTCAFVVERGRVAKKSLKGRVETPPCCGPPLKGNWTGCLAMQTRCYQADFVCVTVRNESSVTGNPFPGIQPIGSSCSPTFVPMLYDLSLAEVHTWKNVFTGRPFRFKWTRDGQEETEREKELHDKIARRGWLASKGEEEDRGRDFVSFVPFPRLDSSS